MLSQFQSVASRINLDERTIGNAFNKNDNSPTTVSFPQNVIKTNKCETYNLKLNTIDTIGISNNSTFNQYNFNNDNYQLNPHLFRPLKTVAYRSSTAFLLMYEIA